MERNQILILEYLLKNGKVMFPIIHNEYSSEMTQNEFSESIHTLSKYKLIKFDNEKIYIEITESGKIKLNQIISQIENELEKTKKESVKANLEILNLNLQNENLKYSKTLRKKETEIRELTTKNLNLQNRELKLKLIYTIIGFALAYLINNADKILKLFNIKVPEWLK